MKKCMIFAIVVLMMMGCVGAYADQPKSRTSSSAAETLDKLYERYYQIDAQLKINALPNSSAYKTVPDYDDWERSPKTYSGKLFMFSGKVIQVSEGDDLLYRVALNGNSSDIILVTFQRPDNEIRILTDDQIVVYGKCTGITSYQSTIGKQVTIPAVDADLVTIKVTISELKKKTTDQLKQELALCEEKIEKKLSKNKNGIYEIEDGNYADYSRRVTAHLNEQITWNGKVLQIMQNGKNVNLRISVNNSSNVIYTVINESNLNETLLEDDQVVVIGQYTGLYTYESTLGGNITIPLCQADSVTLRTSKKNTSLKAGSDGYYTLNDSNYDEFFRHAAQYTGYKVKLRGQIVQVIDEKNSIQYRIRLISNTGTSSSNIVFGEADSKTVTRMLNDDKATIYGQFIGTVTYTSTLGAAVTIPSISVEKVEIDGYYASAAKKSGDIYTITKTNYDSFARGREEYVGSKVTFSGTVIQAVDDSSTCTYRIAVGGSSSCIVLAQIDTEKLHTRILEDDKVKITGLYTGLYSYSSALGGKITVPSCYFDDYSITNYKKQNEPEIGKDGFYTMTKTNYENYARSSSKYEGQKTKFNGKIIQVMEGSSYTHYRIAVGGKSNCMIYVEYILPSSSKRFLEGDTVSVYGEYTGLYSYTTTLGSTVTIPSLKAIKIQRIK